MILRSLRVRGWRNLTDAALIPGPRVTVLHGRNGQGKTNLIEAAHYVTTFRSFRAHRVDELVAWGAPGAHLEADVQVGGLERRIDAKLASGRKSTRLDGKPVRRAASALSEVAAVLFVPEDLLLPRAAPAERRRFLDRAIFAADRGYAVEATALERVLKSRNAVLRQGQPPLALLDTYDEQMAHHGARIVLRRRALTAALAPRVETLFRSIHADIGTAIRYRSHPEIEAVRTEPDLVAALRAGLLARRTLDERRAFTGFGPHTDDLVFDMAGHPAADHGSQGQLRSLVLALKLAELAHLTAVLGASPLLLLDDVASELDEIRRCRLFETISALPGQTLITVTEPQLLPQLPERRDFEVEAGQIRKASI